MLSFHSSVLVLDLELTQAPCLRHTVKRMVVPCLLFMAGNSWKMRIMSYSEQKYWAVFRAEPLSPSRAAPELMLAEPSLSWRWACWVRHFFFLAGCVIWQPCWAGGEGFFCGQELSVSAH